MPAPGNTDEPVVYTYFESESESIYIHFNVKKIMVYICTDYNDNKLFIESSNETHISTVSNDK